MKRGRLGHGRQCTPHPQPAGAPSDIGDDEGVGGGCCLLSDATAAGQPPLTAPTPSPRLSHADAPHPLGAQILGGQMKLSRAALSLAVVAVTLLAGVPSHAAAAQRWQGLDKRYGGGSGIQACVAAAARARSQAWSCVGGELTSSTVDKNGKSVVHTTTVSDEFNDTTSASAGLLEVEHLGAKTPAIERQVADDYDSWCESGSVCGRKISNYIAEVKGNGAYGNQNGVIGAFDFIVRQAFDGPWPRWRSLLIWDYGPAINPYNFVANCRVNVTGPDGHCGGTDLLFSTVSSGHWRSWWPSSTGYDYNSQKLKGSTYYHDDMYGSFKATGYSLTFHASTIHTGRWRYCSSNCTYYQVPWTP